MTETAEEMGIESELQSLPAEAIGGLTEGVTPLEMADAYATLANGGIHHEPTAVSKVEFPNGKVDEPGSDSGDRVLTPGQAYEVTRILEGVITQGTGAPYTYMGCTSEAGKTGTSEEESDAWFVGYTPLYSTAVWVGHPTVARIHRLRRPHRRADLAELHVGGAGRRMPGIRSAGRACPNSPPYTEGHTTSGSSEPATKAKKNTNPKNRNRKTKKAKKRKKKAKKPKKPPKKKRRPRSPPTAAA